MPTQSVVALASCMCVRLTSKRFAWLHIAALGYLAHIADFRLMRCYVQQRTVDMLTFPCCSVGSCNMQNPQDKVPRIGTASTGGVDMLGKFAKPGQTCLSATF
jgi:hypothetical protein